MKMDCGKITCTDKGKMKASKPNVCRISDYDEAIFSRALTIASHFFSVMLTISQAIWK